MSGRRQLDILCPPRLNARVTPFGHNVHHARPKHPNIAASRSGEDRLRAGRKQSRIHHGPARAHPNAQGAGPQHARHNLRDGNPNYARGFVVHRLLALLPVARTGPIIVAVIVALVSSPLSAREYRSRQVTREFQREHPCPSTGKTTGGCPGCRKGSRDPPRLRRPRCGFEPAMANDLRGESQGPMGAAGLRSIRN